jgi:hypothetical protein
MERRLLGGSPVTLLDLILRHQVGSYKTTCSSVDYPTMARPLRIEFSTRSTTSPVAAMRANASLRQMRICLAWLRVINQDVELIRLSEVW